MSLLKVELEKCIKCGACADVCPSRIIAVDKVGGPERIGKRTCIACGHCVAVCPTAALDNRRSKLAEHVELDGWTIPDKDEMIKILRSRRSTRAYRKDKVTGEKITELLDLARYAETGSNSQGLSFISISNVEVLQNVTEAVVSWMEEQIRKEAPNASYFEGAISSWRNDGYDSILRGAPGIIVAIAPEEHRSAQSNCEFVWTYAELFAPSLGLGTCIAGYTQLCAWSGCKQLLELFELPEGSKVAGVLMVGYPCYKYKRLPPRQPLNVYIR